MLYFFDESGQWQGLNEARTLVIAGVLIKDKNLEEIIKSDFKSFKQQHKLSEIHTTTINSNPSLKQKLDDLVLPYLQNPQVKPMAYVVDPKKLKNTQKSEQDIYIDYASDLISNMILKDPNPIIEYDMKFHYSYPQNVVYEVQRYRQLCLQHQVNEDFEQMRKLFILTKAITQGERIKSYLEKHNIQIKKFNEAYVTDYLWEEFRLNVQESFLAREKLKDRIYQNIKNLCNIFKIPDYNFNLEIKYSFKHQASAGVELVDYISNTVYHQKKANSQILQNININYF